MLKLKYCQYITVPATIAMLLTIGPALALADIYQQVDDDGVVCFTDTPTAPGYSLLLRERQAESASSGTRRNMPAHLAAIAASAQSVQTTTSKVAARNMGGNLPIQGRVTSLAGFRTDPFDGKIRHHNGMDIACPSGTPIKPVAPGTVIFSGSRPGYGNVVVVEHPGGTITLYAHNSRNLAASGESVEQTSIIAYTGSSGRSTGPHLHFEAWNNDQNITHSFQPNSASAPPTRTIAEAPTRRYLQADGTLVFTNLP